MSRIQHRIFLLALFIINVVVISHPLFARPNTIEYNLRAILGRRAARDISAEELREYETVLTSDSLAGRKTTTPGMWKAANYIARQFRQFGLKPLPGTDHYFLRWPILVHRRVAPPQLSFFNGADSLDLNGIHSSESFPAPMILHGLKPTHWFLWAMESTRILLATMILKLSR